MAKKVYLVDTENVGSVWVKLLELITKQDELILFYTENSPAVSYQDLRKVLNYTDKFDFIRCYSGRNGLDFQLVTYLGYLLKSAPKTEYIVVSNDMGFDTAVKFWNERDKKVTRLNAAKIHIEYNKFRFPEEKTSSSVKESEETLIPSEPEVVLLEEVSEEPSSDAERREKNIGKKRGRRKAVVTIADGSSSGESSNGESAEKNLSEDKATAYENNGRKQKRTKSDEKSMQAGARADLKEDTPKEHLTACLKDVLTADEIDWVFDMLVQNKLPSVGLNKIYCEIIKHFAQEKGLLVYKTLRPGLSRFTELINSNNTFS